MQACFEFELHEGEFMLEKEPVGGLTQIDSASMGS